MTWNNKKELLNRRQWNLKSRYVFWRHNSMLAYICCFQASAPAGKKGKKSKKGFADVDWY